MTILAVLIGIAIVFLIILCAQWSKEEEDYTFGIFCGWTMAALFVLEALVIIECTSKPYPKAMDVYQGKTTLEYTIRNGVKVDSIVVFKK